jgi:hypothetical protein
MPPPTLKPGLSRMTHMWPRRWADDRGRQFDVYPTAYQGELNYKLSDHHARIGIFPTAESLAVRDANDALIFGAPKADPRDALSILDDPSKRASAGPSPAKSLGGMQGGSFKAVRLDSGAFLFRFGDPDKRVGGWWSDRRAMIRILLRVEPAAAGLQGVRGGSELNIRDYARKYSEVLNEWSNGMRYVWCTRTMGAISGFRGMGADQRSERIETVLDIDGNPCAITYEHMNDDNIQLFIPNVFGRVDAPKPGEPAFFSAMVKWLPEVLEVNLVPQVREAMERKESMKKIFLGVEDWLMGGNRHATFIPR